MDIVYHFIQNFPDYVIFFITIVGSFLMYFRRKIFPQKLRLNCYVAKKIDLNNIQRENLDLDITSSGVQIENPKLISIKFTNLGNILIDKLDWEAPMKFVFSKDTKILNCFISEKSNENIVCFTSYEGSTVSIKFGSLNPIDSITIDIILDSESFEFKEYYRIRGVDKIEHKEYVIRTKDVFKVIGIGTFQILAGVALFILMIFLIYQLFQFIGALIPEGIKDIIGKIIVWFILISFLVGFIVGVINYVLERSKRKI